MDFKYKIKVHIIIIYCISCLTVDIYCKDACDNPMTSLGKVDMMPTHTDTDKVTVTLLLTTYITAVEDTAANNMYTKQSLRCRWLVLQ